MSFPMIQGQENAVHSIHKAPTPKCKSASATNLKIQTLIQISYEHTLDCLFGALSSSLALEGLRISTLVIPHP